MTDLYKLYPSTPEPVEAAEAPAGLDEIFRAARTLQAVDNTDANDRRMERTYQPYVDAVNDMRRREGLPAIANPVTGIGARDPRAAARYGNAYGQAMAAAVGQDAAQAAFFSEVGRMRRARPDFLPDLPATPAALMARAIQQDKASREAAAKTIARGEGRLATAAEIAGGVTKAFEDPVNLWTLPIGGGGRTVLGIAAREGLLNMATEALSQPQVARNRAIVGEQLTTSEMAANIGFAGAGGAVMGGAGAAIAKGIGPAWDGAARRLFDALPPELQRKWASAGNLDTVLPDVVEDLFGAENLTDDMRAAVNVVRREGDVAATSPVRRGRGDDEAHADLLADVMSRIDSAPPATIAAKARLAGGTALARAPIRRPVDIDVVFRSLVVQESGGQRGIPGPMTRYGQAHGLTQVLDSTAEATAKKLGIAWRPDLMRGTSDEAGAYQLKIGRAYFEEGLKKYDGDLRRALMYYHGGPDQRKWGPKTHAYASEVMARARGGRLDDAGDVEGRMASLAADREAGEDAIRRLDASDAALDAEAARLAEAPVAREQAGEAPVAVAGERYASDAPSIEQRLSAIDGIAPAGSGEYRVIHPSGVSTMPSIEGARREAARMAMRLGGDDQMLDAIIAYPGGDATFGSVRIAAGPVEELNRRFGTPYRGWAPEAIDVPPPRAFRDWLAERVGTRDWVVAPRLTEKLKETYSLAIPQARFSALKAEYEAAMAVAEDVREAAPLLLADDVDAVARGMAADDPAFDALARLELALNPERPPPAAEVPEALRVYDDAAAASAATESLLHDLRQAAGAAPDATMRIDAEGDEVTLARALDELDEEDAVIAAVEGCL